MGELRARDDALPTSILSIRLLREQGRWKPLPTAEKMRMVRREMSALIVMYGGESAHVRDMQKFAGEWAARTGLPLPAVSSLAKERLSEIAAAVVAQDLSVDTLATHCPDKL